MGSGNFIVAFVAGLASFLSPCVLPLVPVYLAYLTGTTYHDLTKTASRWRTTLHALAFVAGFSIVFIAFGASATYLGGFLFHYRIWIERIGGAVLMLMGLWMLGIIPIGFLYRDIRVHLTEKPAGYLGSVVVGAAFAAGWTPCVGPVLSGILLMASRADSIGYGVLLLAAYSLGLAIPLLICSIALESSFKLIKKISPALPALERLMGVCLVLMGAVLLLGWFTKFSSWSLNYFSGWTRLFGGLGL